MSFGLALQFLQVHRAGAHDVQGLQLQPSTRTSASSFEYVVFSFDLAVTNICAWAIVVPRPERHMNISGGDLPYVATLRNGCTNGRLSRSALNMHFLVFTFEHDQLFGSLT